MPQVPFPASLSAPFTVLSFVNLNVLSTVPLDCAAAACRAMFVKKKWVSL